MKKANLLSRAEMRNVMGGLVDPGTGTPGGDNGNPCVNCTNIGHQLSDGDTYGSGNCNTLPASQQSGCHNYCYDAGNYTWC